MHRCTNEADLVLFLRVVFDESGHFLLYATMLGIKGVCLFC